METLCGRIVGDRKLGRRLQETGTSVVYKVHASEELAFKLLLPTVPADLRDAEVQANVEIQGCPFIISAVGSPVECDGGIGWFMHFCESGDLFEVVHENAIIEDSAKRIFYRVMKGIEWLHKNGWAHRAIQLENILLDRRDGEVVPTKAYLGDLSFAQKYREGDVIHPFRVPVGSPLYCAPELYRAERYDQTVDIWAFGVSIFAALTGLPPFPDPEQDRERFLSYANEEEFELAALTRVDASRDVQDLISRCLKAVPGERLKPEEILSHAWFAGVTE
jgi:serine/threonine protein kinase